MSDKGKSASQASTDGENNANSVHPSIENDISKLMAELQRLKEKLSDIDERTQSDSRAVHQASFTLNALSGGIGKFSFLPHEPILPPEDKPDTDIFRLFLSGDDDFHLAHKYMKYQTLNQKHQHHHEENMLKTFQRNLRAYYRDLQAIKEGENTGSHEDFAGTPILSSLKPVLNYVDWNGFKASNTLPKGDKCVIDVLVGEPNLSHSHSSSYSARGKTAESQVGKEREAITVSTIPGQKPMPERIRINSWPLLNILADIEDVRGQYSTFGQRTESVVMVRPFKYLTLCHAQIQESYDRLQKAIATDSPVIPDQAEENTDQGTRSVEENERQEASTHLRCLLDFISSEIVNKREYLGTTAERVSFAELWHLFRPGTEVIHRADRRMQCFKVIKVTTPRHHGAQGLNLALPHTEKGRQERFVCVHCVYLDFDGILMGPASIKFFIPHYEGFRDIKSLPVYPLRFHDDHDGMVRRNLISRGQKFLKVVQVGHMHCSGLTLEHKDEVDSQVVVDFREAFAGLTARNENDIDKGWMPYIEHRAGIGEYKVHGSEIADNATCRAGCCKNDTVMDDALDDEAQSEEYLSRILSDSNEEKSPPLAIMAQAFKKGQVITHSDDDLVLLPYRVFGFVLRNRRWDKLHLDDIMDLGEYRRNREIENPSGESRSKNAFDNLVFPNDGLDRKKIIRSLVAQHFRDRESETNRAEQFDIVRGKGKGLIILLHGAPGVGKTSTAEGIAELFNKPLFQITCGDLGTSAKEVEEALETNFALANKWGSILLLDEADVFLARRTPHDFLRNGLVAVFLRVLEYYAGILFLTTNRIGDFDEAFSSRIHISLHYPTLDYNSTVDIFDLNWRLMKARFRNKGRALEIDESKITGFISEYWHVHPNARWNGRQIRNACHTALALAEYEAQTSGDDGVVTKPHAKVQLAVSHMKTVSDAYLEFIKYLQDVRDADQEKYAYLMGIRRQEGKDMPLENPLAYNVSTPVRRGQVSRLAEHRARSAARYNRPEQSLYPPQNPYPGDHPGHRPASPGGGGVGAPPYQTYSRQPSGTGTSPYHPPAMEPQQNVGWNPGPVGGYYAQDSQYQQGRPSSDEGLSGGHSYGQQRQP